MSKDSLKEDLDECIVIYNPHAKDISSKDARCVKKIHWALLVFAVIFATIVTYTVSYCFFLYMFTYMTF